MRCAIMQPTYMPWSGYFNLIHGADLFVFLDDVQLSRPSWQTRNRILLNGRPFWIAVPAKHIDVAQLINTTLIDDSKTWRGKTITMLRQTYAKRPYVNDMLEVASIISDHSLHNLAELNIRIILYTAERLGLSRRFLRSSELGVPGTRTEKLIGVCRSSGCDVYLSPVGSAEYLENDRFVERSGFKLRFQTFHPEPYRQSGNQPFVSHLSILDLIANIGWEGARRYVRTGRSTINQEA